MRLKLDDLPFGTPIPRWLKSQRVSWPGLSVMLGLSLTTLTRCIQARAEVQERLRDGRLVLGQPYFEGRSWRDALNPARDRVIVLIEARAVGPHLRPIDIEPLGKGKVLMEPFLDEAGVTDQRVRDALGCNQLIRKTLARVVAIVGTRKVGEAATVAKPLVDFADLIAAGTKEAEDAYRLRNPAHDATAVTKAGGNEATFINRVMRLNGWSNESDVAGTLLAEGAEAAVAKGLSQNPRSDKTYLNGIERWTTIAKAMIATRKAGTTFGERLSKGIAGMLMSAKAFAERYELPYDAILLWQRGVSMPTSHQLHLVHRIEKAFGFGQGGAALQDDPRSPQARLAYP